jgi:hypothetical protein
MAEEAGVAPLPVDHESHEPKRIRARTAPRLEHSLYLLDKSEHEVILLPGSTARQSHLEVLKRLYTRSLSLGIYKCESDPRGAFFLMGLLFRSPLALAGFEFNDAECLIFICGHVQIYCAGGLIHAVTAAR